MLLTDSEIMDINQNAEFDSAIGYARKIESAVLEKLKAQEPFGYFKAEPFGWTDCAETDDGAKPLYEHPLPPDDVVRDPRVAELEAVLRECREAMQRAKYSGTPYTSSYNRAIAKIDEVLK